MGEEHPCTNYLRLVHGHARSTEVPHIEMIIGPRGRDAEIAFGNTLTNQKRGDNAVLALVAPNLLVKSATVMFNEMEIWNKTQANQRFDPADRGVSKAVADSALKRIISQAEAMNLFIFALSSPIGRPKTMRKPRIEIMGRPNSQSLTDWAQATIWRPGGAALPIVDEPAERGSIWI